ncbi:MAG: 16S rRNA (cytosine(1402)-N(4))-methyltransferase RsmH [Verrucomicrobiota bacterium]|nr:16S rRNA (cytosine(1402)-N(4))-methyltransferase RsmH [Limisphaera sp.]MDW8381702.1 16S rRNA (cytosine(1402)-N(4))-methyltransferase RsmH [Verrucomicrobiota bacterium]
MEDWHRPVLLAEVLALLAPRPGGRFVDATVGTGGHARALLEASGPDGWLLGIDRDPEALVLAAERLRPFAGRYELRRGNYADVMEALEFSQWDAVLLDLGVSSLQLNRPERGFSFQADGPLDMRMDPNQRLTAADLVNTAGEEDLVRWFRDYGQEPRARSIARAVVRARPLASTWQLAHLVCRVYGRTGGRRHPATRVFQALRIVVNDELGALERGLHAAWRLLRPGGRLAVITFHSLEARLVKDFGRDRVRSYECPGGVDVPELRRPRSTEGRWVTSKAIRPSATELRNNPRSRSAQLRVLEKL